jgi:hypothetical protein
VARRGRRSIARKKLFGAVGRSRVRQLSVMQALEMIELLARRG